MLTHTDNFPHAGNGRNPNENRHNTFLLHEFPRLELSDEEIGSDPFVRVLLDVQRFWWDLNREPNSIAVVVDFDWSLCIDSNGGFDANHSLVAGRAAGRGYRSRAHTCHLDQKNHLDQKK